MKILVLMFLVTACGSTNKIKVSGGATTSNDAEVRILISYPEAQRCFDSPLIDTYEKLKVCLELTTDKTFTVGVDGDVTEVIDELEGAVDGIDAGAEIQP